MDFLGVKDNKSKNKRNNSGKKRSKRDDVKVVYISSPIKVRTSASEFRALVQELTGKDSDIADSHFAEHDDDNYHADSVGAHRSMKNGIEFDQSPSCSDSALETLDHDHVAVTDPMGDMSFMEMLSSSLFNDQSYVLAV